MAAAEGESLESLLNKATNPAKREDDWEAIMAFCDQVNKELEGPQISVRLLAHKIQSPQEREALFALNTLEACIKNCGRRFHQEIGKFRFLNEMIKVVSPKYLGNHTTQKVKDRVIELMYSWTKGLKHETKIVEAYDMLKRQGIVTTDPVHIDKTIEIPTERPRKADFEDDEKSKLLAKLLKSKHPEDLQAANRLIKNMVKQDAERMEKVSKRVHELETVNNNVKLLQEMLTHYQPGSSSDGETDLMKELYQNLEKQRPTLFRLASDTDDKDNTGMSEILAANDEVVKVMNLYKSQVGGVDENGVNDTAKPSSLLDLESPKAPLGDSVAGDSLLLSDELAAFGIQNDSAKQNSSTISTDSKTSNDLEMLSDLFGSVSTSSTNSMPNQDFGALGMPASTSLSGGQGNFQQAAFPVMSSSIPPLTGGVSQPLTGNLNQPMAPTLQPVGLTPQPSVQQQQQTTSNKPPSSGLDDLDILGKSLIQQNLPQDRMVIPPSPAPKVPMNQMQKQAAPNPTNVMTTQRTLSGSPAPITIASTNSSVQSTLPSLAGVSPISTPPSSVTASPLKTPNKQGGTVEVQPLADIFVPLESVQPGTLPPLTAYDKNGMKIVVHFGKDSPRLDVTVMVVSIMSTNPSPVKNLMFQAAVPKVMRVKLQPPSASDLPAFNPILPPAAITQVMLIANPQQEKIRLKYKLMYYLDNHNVTDVGEVTDFPVQ